MTSEGNEHEHKHENENMENQSSLLSTTEYDVIIVGTGLAESILAASLSLSGSSVIHLDHGSFYGSSW